jgi:site-specific recombinase XerD
MPLTLKRRSRNWYVVGMVNGHRVNQSLKTADLTVARSLMRDLELRLLSGGRLSRRKWKDFQEEFLHWIEPQVRAGPHSTFAKYSFVLNRFAKFLADQAVVELGQVQPATVAAYAKARRGDVHPTRKITVGLEGLKADMRILHRVFAYAEECGYLDDNPVRMKNRDTVAGNTQPFSEEEVARMLTDSVVSRWPQMKAIIMTFLFTGLRISDVIRFPVSALDLKNDRIVIRTQKRGKIVSLAIHPELRAALEGHLAYRNEAQRRAEWLFTSAAGKPIVGLDGDLRRVFKRCKVEGGRPHRFRDTFAVRLLAIGASLYHVAKMLGITMRVAEESYSPYVKELQERSANLIHGLTVPKSSHPPASDNLVQFCAPLSPVLPESGETEAKTTVNISPKAKP